MSTNRGRIRHHTAFLQHKCDALRVVYETMPVPTTSYEKRRRTVTARRYADACTKLARHVSMHAENYA